MSPARTPLLTLVLLAAALGGGCATGNFSMRSLPAETPAENNAAAVRKMQALQASRSARTSTPQPPASADVGPPLTAADVPSLETYDPWERMNRFTYRFNARLDERLFLPVTDQYRKLPSPMRTGVHNFFGNLREVVSTLNYFAQLRPAPGVRSLGRFVINSTLGIGGLFDVATVMKIPNAPTGFGNTLARYGMHPGPYLVLPLLGPNSVRDGIGWGVDYGVAYTINLAGLYQGLVGWVLTPLDLVDARANVDFRYYDTGSPFEYDNVRFLYVRMTLLQDDALRLWHRDANRADQPAGK
jgi:phospholipid-binding lipoprotein MlaA